MTPREIVIHTLEYSGPERVARSFGESDFVGAGCTVKTHATDWTWIGDGRWERIDEWGNTWARLDPTSKGEVVKGVLTDIADMDAYRFPDYSPPAAYAAVSARRKEAPDKWLIGNMPGFAFNIARKMRKLDQYLMDLVLETDRMHALHDRIDAMLEDMIRNYAAAGADCVMFPEDWGTQNQTLISPALWREEFFPRFQRLCGLAHRLGIKVFMHSCGQIEAIVPGLMEAGVDVLQFDQPDLHGIDTLASHQARGKITFWCPVDIQTTLQQRNEAVIRAKVREMLDKLWRGRGGLIAGYYGDNASIGLDPVWQGYACDEFTVRGVRGHNARGTR
jgi:uroporphyrinogen decarboxylase